jgi:hypothetical protein
MIHPFSEAELRALGRSRRWYSAIADLLPWSERRRIVAHREGRLFDLWTAGDGDDPPGALRGGGVQGWEECLDATVADGTQVSNTVTETIICPDFNIPAYYMAPGRVLRLWAYGVMSNVVTTPGTLILAVRWGGAAGTMLMQSAARGLDTTARTNSLWSMFGHITCRTAGATGTFLSGGIFDCNVLSSTAANLLPGLMGSAGNPLASGSVAVTADTTIAKSLSVTAKFSVATSPTNLTCQSRLIEVLN